MYAVLGEESLAGPEIDSTPYNVQRPISEACVVAVNLPSGVAIEYVTVVAM